MEKDMILCRLCAVVCGGDFSCSPSGTRREVLERVSKNFENKKLVVAEIKQKLEAAQSVVLYDYRGLTVAEVTELRNLCRAQGVEYCVLKNTMVTLAAAELNIEGLDEYLKGPTAVAFGMTDAVAPAKILTEYVKKIRKTQIKGGVVDGTVIDVKGVAALAELPPKEVLIAKMMGSLNAPISNCVGIMAAILRTVVYAVEGVRKQKAGE